jgi:hypothetical protein
MQSCWSAHSYSPIHTLQSSDQRISKSNSNPQCQRNQPSRPTHPITSSHCVAFRRRYRSRRVRPRRHSSSNQSRRLRLRQQSNYRVAATHHRRRHNHRSGRVPARMPISSRDGKAAICPSVSAPAFKCSIRTAELAAEEWPGAGLGI